MRSFENERAAGVGGAVARVAGRPDAVFLAGGTNLLDHMKLGIAGPGRPPAGTCCSGRAALISRI